MPASKTGRPDPHVLVSAGFLRRLSRGPSAGLRAAGAASAGTEADATSRPDAGEDRGGVSAAQRSDAEHADRENAKARSSLVGPVAWRGRFVPPASIGCTGAPRGAAA